MLEVASHSRVKRNLSLKPVVLIVDDPPEILELIEDTLSEQYQTFSCTNGIIAVELAQQCMPDVILFDSRMPFLGGLNACQKTRNNPLTQVSHYELLARISSKITRARPFRLETKMSAH